MSSSSSFLTFVCATDNATDIGPPVAKKQRTAPAQEPSLFLETNADILGNVYSFLTLKKAVVLRRTCQQLNNDSTIFRYSHIVSYSTTNTRRLLELKRQERAMCNIGNASHLRALLANKTLPVKTIEGFVKKLIQKSRTDNGEAVSVLLQDERCRVQPKLLDMALRKDFASMAAALQQNDEVRASIRMCTTCSVNIGAYECFKRSNCKLKPKQRGDKPPKYCRACALANHTFCACGEVYCNDCRVGVGRIGSPDSCSFCRKTLCGRGKCALYRCEECGSFTDVCRHCERRQHVEPYCSECAYENYSYGAYYGSSYGGYHSDYSY